MAGVAIDRPALVRLTGDRLSRLAAGLRGGCADGRRRLRRSDRRAPLVRDAMDALLRLSEGPAADARGRSLCASAWLLVVMAAVTCFDVLARKTGLPVPLTKLQELEWHFHARALLAVDGLRLHDQCASPGRLLHREPAAPAQGLDRAGRLPALRAALLSRSSPTTAWISSRSSYALSEQSDSTVGLRYRWFIKGIYAAGLWLVVLGILSVLLRLIVFLFGGRSRAEVEGQIGHAELEA